MSDGMDYWDSDKCQSGSEKLEKYTDEWGTHLRRAQCRHKPYKSGTCWFHQPEQNKARYDEWERKAKEECGI